MRETKQQRDAGTRELVQETDFFGLEDINRKEDVGRMYWAKKGRGRGREARKVVQAIAAKMSLKSFEFVDRTGKIFAVMQQEPDGKGSIDVIKQVVVRAGKPERTAYGHLDVLVTQRKVRRVNDAGDWEVIPPKE